MSRNHNLISELRNMADGDRIDESSFRRLILVAIADLSENSSRRDADILEIQIQVTQLKRRDWAALALATVVALLTIAATWLRP